MSRPAAPDADTRRQAADGPSRTGLVRALQFAIGGLALLFVLSAAAGLYLFSLSRSLPDLDVRSAEFKTPRTSIVYASDGSVLAEWHGTQDRHVVGFDEVSKPMRDAVLAAEDPRFYEHGGVDWTAILKAARGESARPGSTITQQLVKLLFSGGERTLGRKVREVLLAYQLETKSDKRRVLETYMNLVYFGHGAYGVESAARAYFGKSASELTLPESATLAGLIRSPLRYSPRANPPAAKERRDEVLDRMRDSGMIGTQDAAEAKKVAIRVQPVKDGAAEAPYFVEYVKQDLIGRLGADAVYNGGLRVHTTLDRSVQRAAEAAAKSTLGRKTDPDVALVSIEPRTGSIRAMIGGRDFSRDQFNLAAQGRRQPGSAFKPFVLVAALENGATPDQPYDATPYEVRVKDGVWRVDNYENAATAPTVSLRAATQWSVNAVYARMIMEVGPDKVVETARRMGITSPLDPDPAIALGGLRVGVSPLEMASAYGTMATGGMRVPPRAIVKVSDHAGRVLYEPKAEVKRVISQPVAETAASLLHDVVEHGTATAARTGRWAAGKTGTTQSYRDAWFVGWSDDLVTAVWVGYAKGQVPMLNVRGIKVTGGSLPAVLWNGMMTHVSPAGGQQPSQASSGGALVLVRICGDTTQLANPRCPNVVEMYLAPQLVPTGTCRQH